MSFFVEDLNQSAKLRSLAPISQSTFQPSDLVAIANDELRLKLVADIMSVREDFFLTSKTVAIVGGIDHYALPKRAIGNTLKALFYVGSGGEKYELERAEIDRVAEYATLNGMPEKFYFEGDEVVIMPMPSASVGSLQFCYFAKPSQLIETESCAKITAISSAGGTTTFTVDTDLTADLAIGDKVDLLSVVSPFLLWAEEVALAAISSTQMQCATADISDAAGVVEPQVNDYICPTGFANIPMIPVEFHGVLAQMQAVRMLAGLGDLNKWNAAKSELKEMRTEAIRLIKNRVEASPRVLRGGLVRTFRGR
jgi:hypothetical protein